MKTLVIEPDSQADYQLFVGLAKRLHVKYREEQIVENSSLKDMKESEFFSLFGSLEGIDSEMLIDNITSARTTHETDISWTI
ncbi:MAG: hypothetical protein IPM69_06015 [Ignavibacteria bacterium]|nr:hypothetical protein [Ignavibacteria bacterium]